MLHISGCTCCNWATGNTLVCSCAHACVNVCHVSYNHTQLEVGQLTALLQNSATLLLHTSSQLLHDFFDELLLPDFDELLPDFDEPPPELLSAFLGRFFPLGFFPWGFFLSFFFSGSCTPRSFGLW